jgi:hypothetical protein
MTIKRANGGGLGGSGAPGGALAGGGILGSHAIEQSLRFDEGDSAYLTFTPSSNGTDNKKYTFSVWIKLAQGSGDFRTVFSSKNTGSGTGQGHNTYAFGTDDDFEIYTQNGGANPTSPRLYRDRSSWYHFLVVYDTTQSTDTDRVKVYVNGTQQTDYTGTFPGLNSVMASVNTNGQEQRWGRYVSAYTGYFNGYMAEIHMVDGQALSPTDFAEEIDGVWVPKAYSGSYGTNGYKLDFSDSNYIGRDKSGSKTLVTSPSFSTFGGGDTNFTQANYDRAFDNNLTTSSCDRTGSGGIIEITPSSSVTPVSHTMINANSSGYTAASRPNSVLLQGSNDGGSNWTTIDDLTNGSGADTATTSSFSNTTSYAKLRLNISENHSGSNTRFGEYIVIASEDNGDGENIFFNNNLTASDVVPDSPTNNWCTNNSAMRANITHSEGNLKMVGVGGNFDNTAGTFLFDVEDTDGWYWEGYVNSGGVEVRFGISKPQNIYFNQSDPTYNFAHSSDGIAYKGSGSKSTGGTDSSYGDSFTTGDVIGIAVKAGALYFYKNGSIQNSGTAAATGLTGQYVPAVSINSTLSLSTNYGQDSTFAGAVTAGGNSDANGLGDFKHSVPSGYKALCASNLPDVTIGPGQSSQADDYFDTILYTAASSNGTYTHGSISFTPDWSWIKNRNNSEEHYLVDVVRGNTSITDKFLNTNSTDAEGAAGTSGTTFSVTSSGYQFVESSIGSGELYYNSRTYVGWNWKAGTAFSNDASATSIGTIDSAGSVSQDAGFSIVTYTGNLSSSGTASVAHGLGVRPNMVITKSLNVSGGDDGSWTIWHDELTTDNYVLRFTTAAESNKSGNGDMSSLFTTTTFGTNYTAGLNVTGNNYVAYVFANVDGYLKCGSYVGNSDTNGTFVYTGFRPAWILTKSTSSGTQWMIYDNKREGYNVDNDALTADDTATEKTDDDVDILSNGFKWRRSSPNFNQSTYIYLCFAEQPFKFANSR